MKPTESTFTGAGGMALYCQSWLPDTDPRAAILIIHGLGEHSGRYTNVVNALVPKGYAVYGFDHRGHGHSPGKRGHINHWSEYLDDISVYLKQIQSANPGKPIFLFGHSLGAFITTTFAIERPQGLRGIVLSGIPIEPIGAASSFTIFLARIMSGIWPSFSLKTAIKVSDLSRDPEVMKANENDPLTHGYTSARFGTEALTKIAEVKAHPENFKLPVLFIHGGDDPTNTVEGARRYFVSVGTADKKMIVYPGNRHEPHNDLDHVKVLADVSAWLEQHL
jgi:alpha-beta hydrolase superfamily lysophospholipase